MCVCSDSLLDQLELCDRTIERHFTGPKSLRPKAWKPSTSKMSNEVALVSLLLFPVFLCAFTQLTGHHYCTMLCCEAKFMNLSLPAYGVQRSIACVWALSALSGRREVWCYHSQARTRLSPRGSPTDRTLPAYRYRFIIIVIEKSKYSNRTMYRC